jgi:hypothetical protein
MNEPQSHKDPQHTINRQVYRCCPGHEFIVDDNSLPAVYPIERKKFFHDAFQA